MSDYRFFPEPPSPAVAPAGSLLHVAAGLLGLVWLGRAVWTQGVMGSEASRPAQLAWSVPAPSPALAAGKLPLLGVLQQPPASSLQPPPHAQHSQPARNPPQRRKRKLLLHLDVNKAVLISDRAQNLSRAMTINSLLADVAYGVVDCEGGSWTLLATQPCFSPPPVPAALPATARAFTAPPLPGRGAPVACKSVLTFAQYLEQVAYPTGPNNAMNKRLKAQRTLLKARFTQTGQPGAAFAEHRERLLAALRLPSLNASAAAALPRMLAGGFHALIPSFFSLINWLQEDGGEFAIVFRSFGQDFAEVAEELNLFCQGKHPFFHGRCDGSRGTADLRIDATTQVHAFYRSERETVLALHTHKTVPEDWPHSVDAFYSPDHQVRLVRGLYAIQSALQQAVSSAAQPVSTAEKERTGHTSTEEEQQQQRGGHTQHKTQRSGHAQVQEQGAISSQRARAVMVRDYYPFWARSGESCNSGKLLLLSKKAEARGEGPWQVFFDDNVELDRAHIIDARWLEDGSAVPFAESREHFLVKVEPYQAIFNPDYFIQHLQRIRRKWNSVPAD